MTLHRVRTELRQYFDTTCPGGPAEGQAREHLEVWSTQIRSPTAPHGCALLSSPTQLSLARAATSRHRSWGSLWRIYHGVRIELSHFDGTVQSWQRPYKSATLPRCRLIRQQAPSGGDVVRGARVLSGLHHHRRAPQAARCHLHRHLREVALRHIRVFGH